MTAAFMRRHQFKHLCRFARRPALLWSVWFLSAVTAHGLSPDRAISQYVRHDWTVETGLPHGTVRGITQTSDGYLWLATYEGVVRFNGERFRIFDEDSVSSFRNHSIRTIMTGLDDEVWLGTADGLLRGRRGSFELVPIESTGSIIQALAITSGGEVWAGSEGGDLFRIARGRSVEKIEIEAEAVNALATGEGGALWVATPRGLLRRGAEGDLRLTRREGLLSDTVLTLAGDETSLWVGTSAGLNLLTPDGVEIVEGVPGDQITALHRDQAGNLWAGTYSHGLFRVSPDGAVDSYSVEQGLLDPTVRAIFEDDEGSLWVGTNGGLQQFRVGAFLTWTRKDGLADNFTRAVFEDAEGGLWVGTSGGVRRWNGSSWVSPEDPRLAGTYVLSIEQMGDGSLWFGTSSGLFRWQDGEAHRYTTADGLSNNVIRTLFRDRHDSLWIGTDGGLNRYREGVIENVSIPSGAGSSYVAGIAETPDGRVWFATGEGLASHGEGRYVRPADLPRLPSNRLFSISADGSDLWLGTDGDGLIRYRNGEVVLISARQGLPVEKILSIVDDGSGHLWLGTVRGVFRIAKDELHEVAERTRDVMTFAVFDESDGLGSRQCNGGGDPAAFRSRDGRLWFATANGVSALAPPVDGSTSFLLRKPMIENVSIDGREIGSSDRIELPPDAERLQIDYTGVTFIAPDRLRFRYRIDGYDRGWIDGGTSRIASYTNLPPGDYEFQLESSRDGAEWASMSLPLAVIPHFYERPGFVSVLVVLGIVVLSSIHLLRLQLARRREELLEVLVEERTREIAEEKERSEHALRAAETARKEAERHEKMTELALARAEEASRAKSVFLAATSHELRTPLNAIIGFSDILMNRTEGNLDPKLSRFLVNIHSSGEYLLGLINNILDLSKIEAGKMEHRPEPVDLTALVADTISVMKGVTELRQITMKVDIPHDLREFHADPIQVRQILYNLMMNAVKFSPDGSIVEVNAAERSAGETPMGVAAVEIRIVDHGVGIDPADHRTIFQEFRQASPRGERPQGTGLGLALVNRFVEMHGGRIFVESELGKGSTFIVLIPRVR